MSKDLNLCQFIGRLGQDPDVRFTPQGSAIANLSLACGDDYKDKQGNKVEQTNWIRVVAFGRLAEIIQQYVSKGDQIYISGKQITKKWQAQDGTDRYTTEVVANEMQMLGGKQDGGNGRQAAQAAQPPAQPRPELDGYLTDIPFWSGFQALRSGEDRNAEFWADSEPNGAIDTDVCPKINIKYTEGFAKVELTKEHFEILKHAQKNGLFCGDSKEIRELCDIKMMEFAGHKSFVPDPYFKLTSDGKSALDDLDKMK